MQGIETHGRKLLLEWMAADQGRSQGFIARKLDISQPGVHAWVKGLSRPERHFRDALFALCGIPVDAWETEADRAKRDEALARINAEPEHKAS